jgi:hypothetical protein
MQAGENDVFWMVTWLVAIAVEAEQAGAPP